MSRRVVWFLALLVVVLPASADRRRAAGPNPERNLGPVEWLRQESIPFETTEARSGTTDLLPLLPIVGDARIVALGEATHGSREFFTMKHRMVEFLVEEMGFTIFLIEANLPEADRVDDYVYRGIGDPAEALRGMIFWTWDTEEVLDMIQWMREYNLRRGDRPAVRFRGFDPQFAAYPVSLVEAYVERIDAARAPALKAEYDCIRGIVDPRNYINLGGPVRLACSQNIARAYETLAARREQYVAASSVTEYENHLRYARVVVQAENIWSGRGGGRDNFMAENVEWMADVAHPGEKLVLWAHNYHVSAELPQQMGTPLRRRFGDDMVIFGFDFDRGSFTAFGPGGLVAHTISESWPAGWQAFWREADKPRYFIDLRAAGPAAAAYVAQPQTTWSIGSVWRPEEIPLYHRWSSSMSTAFDVVIYIETVTASRLLPYP